jgi:hypothetical protein
MNLIINGIDAMKAWMAWRRPQGSHGARRASNLPRQRVPNPAAAHGIPC